MEKLHVKYKIKNTGIEIPPIIFGTSCLGNLYQALDNNTKLEIIKEWFQYIKAPVVVDTAGKYGAGLALEVIGNGLRELGIKPENITISNKLGWYRVPLTTPEPTFEPGVWENLKFDAVQKINYQGIIDCYNQGLELLGSGYKTDILSVHDPDEFLAAATSEEDKEQRFEDILDAYKALLDLKSQGKTKAIGVGSKDWRVIKRLTNKVDLDWVMLAINFTIMSHPKELIAFIEELTQKGIAIINSAVFHGGFLTGGNFFDYRKVSPDNEADKALFEWRNAFYNHCDAFSITPADACVQFGLTPPGIYSIALNTSKPSRVKKNVESVQCKIPDEFWDTMQKDRLIASNYPYLR